MFLFEVKVLIWSALEIEFFELYFLQPVLLLLFLFIYFFHSFIGCSSCDIQYKFIIQHKKKTEKKKRKEKKKKRSKNPKGVGATGLTSHARHGP